uniref:NADH-ubiquinone oxidoreductase chain 3 n=1 Tax=Scirtothrips dorsalis TaxID=163899 RepID=A0A089PHF5_SCIDO|nr:NADH dehydrogenase subunit 3 [Scirtothrips dorsalis]AIQ80995.1 NADH dehydrogenase subunit 3 [Scirtothrips dorsalis]
MLNVSFMLFTSFTIALLLIVISSIVSKKSINWREKWSPFECGFNFFNSARIPFSMRFFLIAIIFIIFDVEIALLIPLIPTFLKSNTMKWFISSVLLMTVIILGTLLEWKEMSFEWKN